MGQSDVAFLNAEKSIKEQQLLTECFKNRKKLIINKQGKQYIKLCSSLKYKTNGN